MKARRETDLPQGFSAIDEKPDLWETGCIDLEIICYLVTVIWCERDDSIARTSCERDRNRIARKKRSTHSNNPRVESTFHGRAWVFVSRLYVGGNES